MGNRRAPSARVFPISDGRSSDVCGIGAPCKPPELPIKIMRHSHVVPRFFESHVLVFPLPILQGEGDYLCVKVLRHSKSKKTMVCAKCKVLFAGVESLRALVYFFPDTPVLPRRDAKLESYSSDQIPNALQQHGSVVC